MEDAVLLIRELVGIDSTDPGAFEGEISEFVCDWFARRGIETVRDEVLPGRFNVMARIEGRRKGPALVFICHMDTVVAGDGWSELTPPFGAVDRGGRIYGRGACDMKSGLACAMTVFAGMAEKISEGFGGKSAEIPDVKSVEVFLPEFPFVFIGTVDEEDFMRGAEAAIKRGWVSKQDWILDMEPTNGQIQVAHKGRTWFEMTVKGVTAHAGTPWKGADAVACISEAVCEIRREILACPSHEDLGSSTVTFGQIEGGYRPYVVPDRAKAWIDMRLVPPMNTEKAEILVKNALFHACQTVKGCHAEYVITGSRPPVEKDPDSVLLLNLKDAADEITGKDTVISTFPGYTDTAVIAGILGNHNCMSYGPGDLEMAHKPNEYVECADILRCQAVLWRLAEKMCFGSWQKDIDI
ncbi:MAG: M20 family metallopeptidase [Lachnospiraceae bacterium]|nr:M20 family metallopeptidase [Lachnospiraceae bacterium]